MLSKMLHQAFAEGRIKGFSSPIVCQVVLNLRYADDIVVFVIGAKSSFRAL